MGEALYRKYRSKSLDEVVGQEHITETLKNAIKEGRVSHAYLFTGPRGVGKTSVARILASEVNKIAYNDSGSHIDIIEIDAASNRRIDEIRELRDKVHIAPTSAKYKVYIIDEVHMLTKEAFNALLKTLEEPPAHVIFILATTEAHKLPETIISRTQRFTFKPIDQQSAKKHLLGLSRSEKIDIEDEALDLIIRHGEGSFRDSISLLDQLSATSGKITPDVVLRTIGIPPDNSISSIAAALRDGNIQELKQNLDTIYEQGYLAPHVAKSLAAHIRQSWQLDQGTIKFLKNLLEVPLSHDPASFLYLTLVEYIVDNQPEPIINTEKQIEPIQIEPDKPNEPVLKSQGTPKPALKSTDKTDLWQNILEQLKGQHNTLYGIARMADVEIKNSELVLAFQFPFHMRRCNEERNRKRIAKIAEDLSGNKLKVSCILSKKPAAQTKKSANAPSKPPKSDTLESITQVFGGGEILD